MEIAYTVVDQKQVDTDKTQVVVETALPVVINGYGGGRITVTVDNDQLQDQIEQHVANKFVNQVKPTEVPVIDLVGDLTKVQHIIDAVEEAKAEESTHGETGQQEKDPQPSGAPSDAIPAEDPTPVPTPPADPVPSVEPTPPIVEPSSDSPIVESPATVSSTTPDQPAAPVQSPDPAAPSSPPADPPADAPAPGFIGLTGGLGEEEKA